MIEIFKTIGAIFRIRHLMRIEKEAQFLVRNAREIDEIMNVDEVPPDGDTYNALWLYVSAFEEVVKRS